MKNNSQVRVCQQFFKATLTLTQKFIRTSIQGKVQENKDVRGKHEPRHKMSKEQLEIFEQFIKSIPAVPSHYCRNSSSKLYFPAEIKTVANLYSLYLKNLDDKQEKTKPLSLSCFKKIL